MNVLVLIAAHCEPEVLKYTLGTWLEHYDGSYKATVAVSLQADYDRHSSRRAEIEEMSPSLDIVHIDPVNFATDRMYFSNAHAHCLRRLMDHCRHISCTHVAFLDHDLEFKDDFIGWSLRQDADWVVTLFGDRTKMLILNNTYWPPKPSIWHMVVSRKLFDKIMEDTAVVAPEMFGNLVYDTAAKMFEYATLSWGMNVKVFPNKDFEEHVRHLWSLSFQYGPVVRGYPEKLTDLKRRYAERFPNGIGHLLSKIV